MAPGGDQFDDGQETLVIVDISGHDPGQASTGIEAGNYFRSWRTPESPVTSLKHWFSIRWPKSLSSA